MQRITAWATATLLLCAACGPPCAAPSVFPVPPSNVSGHAGRLELALPLSAGTAEAARAFLAGCASDGSSLCDTPVPQEQDCVVTALQGEAGFTTAKACSNARQVTVYDARLSDPLGGLLVRDWVFADDQAQERVIVFHAYFPQQVF